MTCTQFSIVAVATALLGITLSAQQPAAPAAGGGARDTVAALKQSLQQGQALIRKYEWVETTIISLKGEEKARKQNRCYYGADGKVQKVSLDQAAAPSQEDKGGKGGRKGGGRVKQQVVENKKGDIQDYMKQAAALIHQYVPPAPARIQAAKDAGRVKANPQAGGKVQVAIAQYLLPVDSLTIDMDGTANRLLGLNVNSYLDKPEDTVTLAVQMTTLPDGALFASETTLDAKAKNIRVVIQNSGFKPAAK
jgi:hypothetical protein